MIYRNEPGEKHQRRVTRLSWLLKRVCLHESWRDPQQIEADQHCHQQWKWLAYYIQCKCGGEDVHVNMVATSTAWPNLSSTKTIDEHINVVADDTGIFAFLWLWYNRLFDKGNTTSVSTMIKWWDIDDVGLGRFWRRWNGYPYGYHNYIQCI